MRRQAAVEAEGRRAIVLKGDAADPAFSEMAVKATLEAFGRLDVVVPNAAFQEHVEALEDLTLEHFDRTLKTNLYGYFHLVKAAVPLMPPGSAIIVTASVQAYKPSPNLLAYASTKAAQVAFTKALAQQLADKGIRVNAVAPGPVWTPLQVTGGQTQDGLEKFGEESPMKRPGQPAELAAV